VVECVSRTMPLYEIPKGILALLLIRAKLTVGEEVSELEVTGGKPDDAGLVELRGYGRRQGQEFGQLAKLLVLLLPAILRRVPALGLHYNLLGTGACQANRIVVVVVVVVVCCCCCC
jgi:hypothetical protein